jgi:glutathione S-transferase
MMTLEGFCFSPWTEKARWALDHHGVPYRYQEHLLLFGMPFLARKLRMPTGEVTVPALIRPGQDGIVDSWKIALHAESVGRGAPLFPERWREEIRRFNELSEDALDCGRALTMARVQRDREALKEAMPPFIPGALRGPLTLLAGPGMAYLDRHFGITRLPTAERQERIRGILLQLRSALKAADGDHLCGGAFTYADIAMAAALQPVQPVADEFIRIGPATRRAWTTPELAAEFPELLAWRDRIFQGHRRARA